MEEWKDIKGYEGLYQVSNEGRVKRLSGIIPRGIKGDLPIKERILKCIVHKSKHLYVDLCGKSIYVHQLVAEAFIPNPNGYDVVHHKDLNPANNCVENLVWMSKEDHQKLHGKINSVLFSKQICQLALDDELIKKWNRMNDAAKALGINQGSISNCCKGKCKTYKKFKWMYADEYEKMLGN